MADPHDGSLLRRCDAALMRLEALTASLAGLVILALMFLVTTEVVLRRLFSSPIPGQQDATILAMVAFGVLCVSYCYRQAGHIRMDLILKVLDGRAFWAANLLVIAIALLTVTAIWPSTWSHFLRAYEFGDSTFGIGLVLELWVFGRLVVRPAAEPIGVPQPPDPRESMDTG